MIQEFIEKFEENKTYLRQQLINNFSNIDYMFIVKTVVETLNINNTFGKPDPRAIHVIDDGDYQGTLLFIIAEKTYQPSRYWFVFVYYGSCSGCDTLEAIKDSGNYNSSPNEQQINDLMTLALHVVQKLKPLE